jgi:hypothetical protein
VRIPARMRSILECCSRPLGQGSVVAAGFGWYRDADNLQMGSTCMHLCSHPPQPPQPASTAVHLFASLRFKLHAGTERSIQNVLSRPCLGC